MIVARRRLPFSTGVLLAIAACGAPATVSAPTPAGSAAVAHATMPITAEQMRARIYFLSSDVLRGRDTPSPGLESAAAYLSSESQRLGLRPAGVDDTYYQRWPFALRQLSLDGTRLSVRGPGGTQELTWGVDFFALQGAGAAVEGGLVYIGSEVSRAEGASEAGTLRDRVVIVALPGNGTERAWRRLRNRQLAQAREEGARAIIHVLDAQVPAQRIRDMAGAAVRPVRGLADAGQIPQFLLAHDAAQRLFAAGGLSLDEAWRNALDGAVRPVSLPGLTVTASAETAEIERAYPPNVVALLPGSDPVLRDEYVVLTAHFDHVGVGQAVNGDSIYNGADDNSSGTSALLEVARALSELPEPPRRSVMFLWVSGEEKGLLGSRWYADNPTVPIDRVVGNINIDMIAGDAYRDTVVVIGKEYSTMGEVVDRLQQRLPELNLVASDDLWPEEDFFYRSDHLNFLRYDVPALFFFTGLHDCYHRPCDSVDFVNPDKAARVANFVYHTVLEITNADARPRWDPDRLREVRTLTR